MTEIDSDKIKLNALFKSFWFNIPEYQRNYIWESDQINELLDDLEFAFNNHPNNEYFLGSLVLHKKEDTEYNEYDVLDGQQRLTTIILVLAVIRDITDNKKLSRTCEDYIYQEENQFEGIPAKIKISYNIREDVKNFLNKNVKEKGLIDKIANIEKLTESKNASIKNLAKAIILIKNFKFFKNIRNLPEFCKFLFHKVVFIYVSTDDFEDAYRLFTILNNRGVPLRNSDIIKSINIGTIGDFNAKQIYGKKWEAIGNTFKDDDEFDLFLNFIRTIIVKEKARESLLKEYENMYSSGLLEKGVRTIDILSKYQKHYEKIIELIDFDIVNDYKNLITIMTFAIPSTNWIPPLLFFYEKFDKKDLLEFLKKLEYKFVGDWILSVSPTSRITNMNQILKVIENSENSNDVLMRKEIFYIDSEDLKKELNGNIYGKRFTRFILLKREYLLTDSMVHMSGHRFLSVEHILPQNPKSDSQWVKDYNEEERKQWKDKIGNLVLISKKKNSRLSNLDFDEKKIRYFRGRIDVFPSSKVFYRYDKWTKDELKKRQSEILELLRKN